MLDLSICSEHFSVLDLAVKGTYENRMATVFWYLSDVESGGSTHFPRAGGLAHPPTTRGCKGPGRHVTPRAGRGIVFYSLTPDGFGAPSRLCKLPRVCALTDRCWLCNGRRRVRAARGVRSGGGREVGREQVGAQRPHLSARMNGSPLPATVQL